MSRASKILETVTGSQLSLPGTFLKCQSCGTIYTNPTGILAPDGLRGPKIDFRGESRGAKFKCPECGGPLKEVHKSSAAVMGGQSGWAGSVPGGALSGGAFH